MAQTLCDKDTLDFGKVSATAPKKQFAFKKN